jgi:Tfp pilus assembly protein PilF
MATVGSLGDRNVLPRWRSVTNTLAVGELPSARPPDSMEQADRAALRETEAAWTVEPDSECLASEFASLALILGAPDVAHDAGVFLVEAGTTNALQNLGRKVVTPVRQRERLLLPPSESDLTGLGARQHIASLKAELRRDPRRALAWVDLARHYTAMGFHAKAARAIRVALTLAPDHRYVLRAATCFYASTGDPSEAHDLLVAADRTKQDPWLVSAEMAAAVAAGRRPRLVRTARSMAESGRYSALALSELTSELATLELQTGKDRAARRLFIQALVDPTENSLAQAEWAAEKDPRVVASHLDLGEPTAFEARARRAQWAGDWKEAAEDALGWIVDQPFSADAAVMGSCVASVEEDWETSVDFARRGLKANPESSALLNNIAYALLESGRVAEGEAYLRRIKPDSMRGADRSVYLGTWGLLAYRRGDPVSGRALYQQAMTTARQHRNNRNLLMAAVMLAREEMLSRSAAAKTDLAEARKLAADGEDHEVRTWLARLTEVEPTA